MGLMMLKKQYGAYLKVEMPSTPVMYAPQEFHGIRTDVTVPESSTTRESTHGLYLRRLNSRRNVRAGRTIAMYWSPAMMFRPMAVPMTVATSFPPDVALTSTP